MGKYKDNASRQRAYRQRVKQKFEDELWKTKHGQAAIITETNQVITRSDNAILDLYGYPNQVPEQKPLQQPIQEPAQQQRIYQLTFRRIEDIPLDLKYYSDFLDQLEHICTTENIKLYWLCFECGTCNPWVSAYCRKCSYLIPDRYYDDRLNFLDAHPYLKVWANLVDNWSLEIIKRDKLR